MIPSRVLITRIVRALIPAVLSLCAARAQALGPIGARSPYPPQELEDGVPPPVQITCPTPSADTALFAPPTLQIFWNRPHPGPHYARAFEYRYILLGPSSEFPVGLAVNDPGSFRDYYANHPLGPWTGWESTGAHATNVELGNLNPNQEYLFAAIALDRAGGYSPEFGLSTNMLHFVVGFPEPGSPVSWAPVLTMSGPGFKHRYPVGSYCPCKSAEIRTEMRPDQESTFRWSAQPGFICESPRVRSYRWALDIEDVSDETPRFPEETDLRHWSLKSAEPGSAHLGPFAPGETHRLYVEAEDFAGLRSLGIVRIEVLPVAGGDEIELAVEARRGGLAKVSYSLPEPGTVDIGVYDVAGRRVATLERQKRLAGLHSMTWNAGSLGRGIYFCRLRLGSATVTKPMLHLR